MKEYTKMKKIFCDFCEKEINKNSSLIQERVTLKDNQIGVEIRMFSPEKRRFAHDICRICVFEAVDLMNLEHRPVFGQPESL